MSQVVSLYQAVQYLSLPVNTYYYSETAIVTLLLFAKLVNEYYIMCNTRIDDVIYGQSKDDTCDFNKTINSTYTIWVLAKEMWTSIIISTL